MFILFLAPRLHPARVLGAGAGFPFKFLVVVIKQNARVLSGSRVAFVFVRV